MIDLFYQTDIDSPTINLSLFLLFYKLVKYYFKSDISYQPAKEPNNHKTMFPMSISLALIDDRSSTERRTIDWCSSVIVCASNRPQSRHTLFLLLSNQINSPLNRPKTPSARIKCFGIAALAILFSFELKIYVYVLYYRRVISCKMAKIVKWTASLFRTVIAIITCLIGEPPPKPRLVWYTRNEAGPGWLYFILVEKRFIGLNGVFNSSTIYSFLN